MVESNDADRLFRRPRKTLRLFKPLPARSVIGAFKNAFGIVQKRASIWPRGCWKDFPVIYHCSQDARSSEGLKLLLRRYMLSRGWPGEDCEEDEMPEPRRSSKLEHRLLWLNNQL